MSVPVQVVAPSAKPVSLTEIKAHLRVENTEEDALIGAMIDAAVDHLDGHSGVLGRCLVTQEWEERFDRFDGIFRLALRPVASITAMTVFSADGSSRVVPANAYVLRNDAAGGYIAPAGGTGWVASSGDESIVIRYVCGAPVESVPSAIRVAILLMVADLYRFRETAVLGASSAVPISVTAAALLAPYRLVQI